jgi:hypothetical protein
MHNCNEIRGRNSKFVIAGAIAALMLLGTTAISTLTTAESVFAYRNNQATAQASDCGNGFEPTSVGCQNTDSQIQGDKNTVALSSQQTFLPSASPCVACFEPLSDEERTAFEAEIPSITEGQASTIEELCAFFETLDEPDDRFDLLLLVIDALEEIGVDPLTIEDIRVCVRDALDVPV